MNDEMKADEQPENETEVSAAVDEAPEPVEVPAAEQTTVSKEPPRWIPTTAAGRSRLVAAGIAGAFFLGGGIGGYAIGQAGDGPDRPGLTRPEFEGQRGGPGGGPGGGFGQQVQPGQQQAPGDPSGGGVAS